jgi:5'-3' exonuclease, N-terminal resolvase-like domain
MFDYIIIDSVLVGYLVLNSNASMREQVKVGNRVVYKTFVRSFIETISYLKNKFLSPDGEVILLFDNYESREQIRQLLKPLNEHESRKKINPEYKAQRRAEKQNFYNSLDIIRYYYNVSDSHYHTAHIPNLEADDLVKPCIDFLRKKSDCRILLVTNDSDWSRYIEMNTMWLPDLYGEPHGVKEFAKRYGFDPSEEAIILNKIIYGDEADNIKCVFNELNGFTRKFICQTFASVADFMFSAHKYPETKELVPVIKEREQQIRSAYQMLATIPVTPQHFAAVFVTGRDSKIVQDNLRQVFFDQTEKKEESGFEFGGLKVPRHDPKGE